jgi:hypothetical protein
MEINCPKLVFCKSVDSHFELWREDYFAPKCFAENDIWIKALRVLASNSTA